MLKSIGPKNIKRKRNRKNDSKKDPGLSSHKFLTLDDVETSNKRIFLRVDINVPLDPSTHQILDDTRIRAVSETLARLEDARVVLGSHQSRPGKDDFTNMQPHSEALAECCNQQVMFVDDVIGPHARQRIAKVEPGQVLVLKAMDRKISADDEKDMAGLQTQIKNAKSLWMKYKDKIEVPVDLAYADTRGKRTDRAIDVPLKESALDIGAKTVEIYSKVVEGAATTVANGPLGVFERDGFDLGTKQVLEAMARSNGYTVIGGGHLVGLASILGIDERFKHVSTAGGAMLSLLSGQSLPGVDALVRAAERMRNQKNN